LKVTDQSLVVFIPVLTVRRHPFGVSDAGHGECLLARRERLTQRQNLRQPVEHFQGRPENSSWFGPAKIGARIPVLTSFVFNRRRKAAPDGKRDGNDIGNIGNLSAGPILPFDNPAKSPRSAASEEKLICYEQHHRGVWRQSA